MRAGGREEEGEAEPLSPGRGAGRDPASAVPGRPDRGRGGPRSPGQLVRPRGQARSQPGADFGLLLKTLGMVISTFQDLSTKKLRRILCK